MTEKNVLDRKGRLISDQERAEKMTANPSYHLVKRTLRPLGEVILTEWTGDQLHPYRTTVTTEGAVTQTQDWASEKEALTGHQELSRGLRRQGR